MEDDDPAATIEMHGLTAERLSPIFTTLEVADADRVHGRYSVVAADGLDMVRARTAGGRFRVRRRARHIARDPGAYCFVCLPFAGEVSLRQQGRRCALGAGDLGALDALFPYEIDIASGCDALWLRLPTAALRMRPAVMREVSARRVDGGSGLGLLAARYARTMFEQWSEIAPHVRPGLTLMLSDLVGQALVGVSSLHEPFRAASARTLERARIFIEHHLTEDDLTPARIASGIGISQRYLGDLFARVGETTMGHVVRRRLERCREALTAECWRPGIVTDLAFAHGFVNMSSFNRMFRQTFGATPRAVMRQPIGADPAGAHRTCG